MKHFLSNCLLLSAVQPSNPKEAMKWLKQSAENGYVRAQYQLALCLHQGRVVKTNLLEAVCDSFSMLLVEILQNLYCFHAVIP